MARSIYALEGQKETQKALMEFGASFRGRTSGALHEGAVVLRDALRRAVPRGPLATGALAKGIVAWADRKPRSRFRSAVRTLARGRAPLAMVVPVHRIAPHIHLVLGGTKGKRFPKTASVLRFITRAGTVVFARWVRPMPANDFWRPTVRAWTPVAKFTIERAMKKAAEDARKEAERKHGGRLRATG
jgi:hypothetical protein